MDSTDPHHLGTRLTERLRETHPNLTRHSTPTLCAVLNRRLSERISGPARRWLGNEDTDSPADPSIGLPTLVEAVRFSGSGGNLSEDDALRICEAYLITLAHELPDDAWMEIRSLLPAEIRHRFVHRGHGTA